MIWMNYIIESPYSSIHPTSNIKILLLIIHGHPKFPIFFKKNPGAVLFLGTADTVSRLAVLRHSDTLTAASLDAGLMPLATLMARACGASFGLGATLPTEARKMLHQWLIDLIAWYRQINSGFCGGFSLIDNCGWENDLTCKVSI